MDKDTLILKFLAFEGQVPKGDVALVWHGDHGPICRDCVINRDIPFPGDEAKFESYQTARDKRPVVNRYNCVGGCDRILGDIPPNA